MKRLIVFAMLLRIVFLFIVLLATAPFAGAELDPLLKNKAINLYNESLPLFSTGRFAEAEIKLLEANKLDPNNENILNNLGMVYLKLGNAEKARKVLEAAIKSNPHFDKPYLNLGLACESSGDLVSARTYLTRFLETSKDRKQAERMKDHIEAISKAIESGSPPPEGSPGSGDYFSQLPKDRIYPWPKERLPVKVYVYEAGGVPGYKPSYGAVLNRAIASWEDALSDCIKFQLLTRPERADIVIRWSADHSQALMKAEGGDCRYKANGLGMDRAEIIIFTLDPSQMDRLNDSKISWVALHELGHALGVTGHSNDPADVMYFAMPQQENLPQISARDKATMRRIYTEKLPDTWLTLNEDGLKLLRGGKPEAASKKFRAAHELNNEQVVVTQNLIAALTNLAVEQMDQGSYKKAEASILEAIEIGASEPEIKMDILLKNYELLLKRTGRDGEIPGIYKRFAKLGPK